MHSEHACIKQASVCAGKRLAILCIGAALSVVVVVVATKTVPDSYWTCCRVHHCCCCSWYYVKSYAEGSGIVRLPAGIV